MADNVPLARWEAKLREVDTLCDPKGTLVDAGIRETVAILQLLGIPTRSSCEGHPDSGFSAPWAVLRGHRITARGYVQEEVEAYQAHAWMPVMSLLEKFYTGWMLDYERCLTLQKYGWLMSHGGHLQPGRDPERRRRKLFEYQEEMQRFTEFLKQRFFERREQ
jgi:hypothetical protein